MIYLEEPTDFNQSFVVVACWLEYNGKFLLLHRGNNESQPNKWGAPGGKVELGESRLSGMVREVLEETGLTISADSLTHFKEIYVTHTYHNFVFDMFSLRLENLPSITIDMAEHIDYRWVTPAEAMAMELVEDMEECVQMFYQTRA